MGDKRIKGLEIMHPAHTARKTEITYSKVENEFPTKGQTKETTKEPIWQIRVVEEKKTEIFPSCRRNAFELQSLTLSI